MNNMIQYVALTEFYIRCMNFIYREFHIAYRACTILHRAIHIANVAHNSQFTFVVNRFFPDYTQI